jgi:hypothetical protein
VALASLVHNPKEGYSHMKLDVYLDIVTDETPANVLKEVVKHLDSVRMTVVSAAVVLNDHEVASYKKKESDK